jgi:hypothetical protein
MLGYCILNLVMASCICFIHILSYDSCGEFNLLLVTANVFIEFALDCQGASFNSYCVFSVLIKHIETK